MLKKSLIAIAVLAIAMPAVAGDIKLHEWPITCTPDSVEVATVDVELNVGYYFHVVNQDDPIVVEQANLGGNNSNPHRNYTGCTTYQMVSNFDAVVSAAIAAVDVTLNDGSTGQVGSWTVAVTGSGAVPGNGVETPVEICATGKDVAVEDLPAGDQIKVAEVTISVTPTGL